MITETQQSIETIEIQKTFDIAAPVDVAFAAMLDELGPEAQMMDGTAMPFKLEAWPGGRWYRDLGDDNGHFWGHVQAIKRPTLLEIAGPLFMSYAAVSNVQYRLSEVQGGTLIKFHHSGFGLLVEGDRNVKDGWKYIHERVVQRAESGRKH